MVKLSDRAFDKFTKIGEYREPNANPVYIEFIGRNKTKPAPIVYFLACEGEVKYIGESRGGYLRPLSYNKNTVMKRQKDAILSCIVAGKIVEVFALEVPSYMKEIDGMMVDCYLAQDYEKHLIKLFNPEWNGRF